MNWPPARSDRPAEHPEEVGSGGGVVFSIGAVEGVDVLRTGEHFDQASQGGPVLSAFVLDDHPGRQAGIARIRQGCGQGEPTRVWNPMMVLVLVVGSK